MKTQAAFALGVLSAPLAARGYNNGLALTPQMGWNSWNYFACDISEDTILSAAQSLVSQNLTKFGYEYLIVDDCWQAPARDPVTGAPLADPVKFPNGIKHLSDKVHDLGLKFGIYSSAGIYTCGGRFGSLDYEEIDAKSYASWGVDYLKYDNCYNEGRAGTPKLSFDRYKKMSQALNDTGRPILYSMCNWGEDGPWNFAVTIANSWRISGDITDNYGRYDDRCPCTDMLDCKLPGYHCAMARIADFAAPFGQKAGPGKWNDLDMLTVGIGGMTYDEYVTHFSLWAILKSPLILGNDVTNISDETMEIITNEAVIAVSQDASGSPASRLWKVSVAGGDISLWLGGLSDGSHVIALWNNSPEDQTVSLEFSDVFTWNGKANQQASWRLHDLWAKDDDGKWGKSVGTFKTSVDGVQVRPHATRMYKAVRADEESKRSMSEL